MSKRQFAATVAAYLTGWVIAQSLFSRVWNYVMRHERDEAFQEMAHDLACEVVDVLEVRERNRVQNERDHRHEIEEGMRTSGRPRS